MSAYSIPLWTILTKWPAPSAPMYVQHGTPSTLAAIAVSISATCSYDSRVPPGIRLGPRSAPSSRCGRRPAARVVKQGVAAVDDGVARFEQSGQRIDALVHRRAGLDHQQDRARRGQDLDQLLQRGGRLEVALVTVSGHELVGSLPRAVVHAHADAVRGEVARQIHAHGRQPDDAQLVIFQLAHPRHYAKPAVSD